MISLIETIFYGKTVLIILHEAAAFDCNKRKLGAREMRFIISKAATAAKEKMKQKRVPRVTRCY